MSRPQAWLMAALARFDMRSYWSILIALLVGVTGITHAKRRAPPVVSPVTSHGVRYVAPNDNGREARVEAYDISGGRLLWRVVVFRVYRTPLLETDVQDVYINELVAMDGALDVTDEQGRRYSINTSTHSVKRLTSGPGEPAKHPLEGNGSGRSR